MTTLNPNVKLSAKNVYKDNILSESKEVPLKNTELSRIVEEIWDMNFLCTWVDIIARNSEGFIFKRIAWPTGNYLTSSEINDFVQKINKY